ncbi:hypothetical protein ABIF72_007609 [Bradyrhizobium japonicum]
MHWNPDFDRLTLGVTGESCRNGCGKLFECLLSLFVGLGITRGAPRSGDNRALREGVSNSV